MPVPGVKCTVGEEQQLEEVDIDLTGSYLQGRRWRTVVQSQITGEGSKLQPGRIRGTRHYSLSMLGNTWEWKPSKRP